jgi:hypothetical protein
MSAVVHPAFQDLEVERPEGKRVEFNVIIIS